MADKPQIEGLKAAIEKTKQVITLSTGVIALTVTFFDKFRPTPPNQPLALPTTLALALACFGLAILAAVWTLSAITGTLDSIDRHANGQSLEEHQKAAVEAMSNGNNIRVPALLMDALFVIAMGLTVASGLYL